MYIKKITGIGLRMGEIYLGKWKEISKLGFFDENKFLNFLFKTPIKILISAKTKGLINCSVWLLNYLYIWIICLFLI